jgi:hypothetical protein
LSLANIGLSSVCSYIQESSRLAFFKNCPLAARFIGQLVSSTPAEKSLGLTGQEIESRRGMYEVVSFLKSSELVIFLFFKII